ncbi:MAG: hypothetical protein ABI318_00035 [Chthoniobacteraceae bacterium]
MDSAEMRKRAKVIAGGIQDLGRRAAANPVSAVLAALAAGFVFGLVLRLFERPERGRGEK